jgi:ABC-type phosphate transport system substrate-binding protein
MTGFSARLATVIAGLATAVALLAGAASASATTTIEGNGSTLQAFAQLKVFTPPFNAKGEGEVKYHESGSGPGLESWGVGGHAAEFNTYEYAGTDQPPNATQKSEIEKAAGGATVLSIPTLQAAVSLIIHVPTGCTSVQSKAKKNTTRLALNDATVEGIFKHSITKWSQIKDDGDTLLPLGCEGTSEITRVVRLEGSGTTAIFKKWMFQVNQAPVDGTKTWNNLAEEDKNLLWPEESEKLVKGKGNPGVVAGVEANAGSIGYANLANAYEAKFNGTGVESWAVVENKAGKKPKYASPEKPGRKEKVEGKKILAEGTSNCEGTVYVNGVGAKFPPKTTEEAWNEVSSTTEETNYPICGFTYDLSLHGFTSIEPKLQPTKEQVELVKKYFAFMVEDGATLLPGSDYLALPENAEEEKSVFKIAKKGVEKIS